MGKKKLNLVVTASMIATFLATLAIGSAMISKTLTVPYISPLVDGWIVVGAGWFIVVSALIGGVMGLVNYFK